MRYVTRKVETTILSYLQHFPAVAILGPRQCGKSTLAKHIISGNTQSLYLDLEKSSDRNRLTDTDLFFEVNHDKLVCLDEIQKMPDLFSKLRSVIDEHERNGQFLILGSASRDLIRQASETLAGRIVYVSLTPFTYEEVIEKDEGGLASIGKYFVRGGFPRSFLAGNLETSIVWRQSFVETFLQRDLPQMGFDIPPETAIRLWSMCAHSHGQVLNSSKLGDSLGYNHQTIKKYLDVLHGTFMLRLLPPFFVNFKKRLVKSPKVYIRDTGILMSLLKLRTIDDLLGHPVFGHAWESMVIENILAIYHDWEYGFYRTSHGAEIDLVLQKGDRRIAIECKASSSPKPTRGFYSALDDLKIEKAFVIAPVKGPSYPLKENTVVTSLNEFLDLELV
ncbi:MAG: ATPase [Bacteroidetes bacterium]|nr:MAG: ATPase [Bacteroidota bacterium]